MNNQKYSTKDYVVNTSLALFLSANAIRSLVIRGMSNSQMLLVYMMALPVVIIIIQTRGRTIKRISGAQVGLLVLLLLSILFSYTIAPSHGAVVVQRLTYFFIVGGLGAFLISNYDYSFELVFRSLVVIGLLIAPIVTRTNYTSLSYEAEMEEWMGVGYFVLLFVVASIYYLFFGKSKRFKLFSALVIVLYASLLLTHAARGTIVAIILSAFVAIIQRALTKGINTTKLTVSIFLLAFFVLISPVLFDILQQSLENTNFVFLSKFLSDEDISNGRYSLYALAIDGFLQSPIVGQGIASLGDYTTYPHNLFLQFFYESGAIIGIIMSFLVIRPISYVFKNDNSIDNFNSKVFISFLIMVSIVELLFSGNYWMKQAFWLFIWNGMYVYSINKIKKKNNGNR